MTDADPAAPRPVQRLDKWLWCARFFKTRSLAAKFVAGGGVRLERDGAPAMRVEKPSFGVRPGDRLAFALGRRVVIAEVRACAARRGPAPEARTLYIDCSPPPESAAADGAAPGRRVGPRPTKKDRRRRERFAGDVHEAGEVNGAGEVNEEHSPCSKP
ncbi:MAG: RNA-binding S4 domain-containing protein [Pseudomonadota bacterium]